MFASAAHEVEPPPELEERVMSVLAEEWTDTPTIESRRPRPSKLAPWLAVAACLALLVGALAWGANAPAPRTGRKTPLAAIQDDANAYQTFLHSLGGKAVRTATLTPQPGSAITGTAVLYDSDIGQSWVLVLARQPTSGGKAFVTISAPDGEQAAQAVPARLRRAGRGIVVARHVRGHLEVQPRGAAGRERATCSPQGTATADHS